MGKEPVISRSKQFFFIFYTQALCYLTEKISNKMITIVISRSQTGIEPALKLVKYDPTIELLDLR